MSVRAWDPAAAPAGEIEAVVAALNELVAADLPADPRWQVDGMVEYLSENLPGERRACWLAESTAEGEAGDPRGIIGHANVLLHGDIGVAEVLVHPAARGRGVGKALVAAVARRAYEEGISSIGVEAICGTPAVRFWEGLGFRRAYQEMRNLLNLSHVDWDRLAETASAIRDGYRVEFHPGGLPKDLLEPYAAAKATRREAGDDDDGELDLRPSSYDAQRLADSLATLNRRGMKPYLVLAIHTDDGEVAALTELVAPRQHPTRGDQYDTIVVPRHSGIGLERAIKARMLCELRVAEPDLAEVQTWNAIENDPISGVNAELGFRPDREWREYEADVLDLINRL